MPVPSVLSSPTIVNAKKFQGPLLISMALLESAAYCPHSRTWSASVVNSIDHLYCCVECKKWSCPSCARAKIRRLAALTLLAQPNRLLTLTIDPAKHANPRDAFLTTSAQVSELVRVLRKRFGPVEYLRVTEVTKQGWPHYHLLVRSAFLPHEVVKREWQKLTGAYIVDLRKVTKTFSAYTYLVKYLAKMHKLDWTDRHVSTSKAFFPAAATSAPRPFETANGHIIDTPFPLYLQEHFLGSTAVWLSRCSLLAPENVLPPLDPIPKPLPPPTQRSLLPPASMSRPYR